MVLAVFMATPQRNLGRLNELSFLVYFWVVPTRRRIFLVLFQGRLLDHVFPAHIGLMGLRLCYLIRITRKFDRNAFCDIIIGKAFRKVQQIIGIDTYSRSEERRVGKE